METCVIAVGDDELNMPPFLSSSIVSLFLLMISSFTGLGLKGSVPFKL
jgi:hypothetical protein